MSSLIFPLTYSKCDHMKVGIQPSFIFINMAAKRYKINTFDCLFAYIYNFIQRTFYVKNQLLNYTVKGSVPRDFFMILVHLVL